jgi:hypothetical protein
MEPYVPLLSGFTGAVIAAAASILGIAIRSRMHAKRDRLRAVGMAVRHWKTRFEISALSQTMREFGDLLVPSASGKKFVP